MKPATVKHPEKRKETREEFVARMHQKADIDPEMIWRELAEMNEGKEGPA